MKRKTSYAVLLTLAIAVLQLGTVHCADACIENLEIEACKIVSEGGYFSIQIRNTGHALNVTLDSDIGFVEHDGDRIEFPLGEGEEQLLLFQAPMIEEEVKTVVITVLLMDEQDAKYLPVEVVDDNLLKKHESLSAIENLKTVLLVLVIAVETVMLIKMRLSRRKKHRKK